MRPLSILLDLAQSASLFVLGVVALVCLGDRLSRVPLARGLAIGACLAASALLSMADPVVWQPGFIFDGRFVGILLAGPVGGVPSVLLVGAACTLMRVQQGGAGLPAALVAIALTSALSVAWSLHGRGRDRWLDHRSLLLIGASSAIPLLVAAATLPNWVPVAERASLVAVLVVLNIVGVQLIGALLVWDRQRRDAMRALSRSEARFAAIAANVPGAIYQRRLTTAGELSFEYVSDGAQALLGLRPGDLVRDAGAVDALLSRSDLARLKAALETSAATLDPFSFESTVRRPDGSVVSLTSRSIPRREPSGDVVWEGIMLDVSERIGLERAAREAEREAADANATKTRFLAFVTHEFRSPLNAILGYCDLAASSPVMSRAGQWGGERTVATLRSYLDTIRHAAEHLVGMTEDLLDLGKTEAGKLDLHPTHVDLPAAVDRVLGLLRHQSDDRSIAVDVEVEPGHAVLADPRRLQQILLNLIGNAVKYSEVGGTVRIAAQTTGERDTVVVEDAGIGMNPDQMKVAFEAYGQVDNRRNRVVAGTGLGLPLVKRLVELHGGSLELDSVLGRGTRVIVRLPRPRTAPLSAAA